MEWLTPSITIALFVAGLFTYRWQKSIDRETQLQLERRKKYDAYIEARTSCFDAFSKMKSDILDEQLLKYFVARDQLLICVPNETLEAVERHIESFGAFRTARQQWESDATSISDDEFRKTVQTETDSFFYLLHCFMDEVENQTSILRKVRSRDFDDFVKAAVAKGSL